MPLALTEIIQQLRAHYGPPEPPPSDDPFELIVWEQVAYLADDLKRAEAFELLAARIGLAPAKLLAADERTLQAVTRHGGSIAYVERAARLREAARIVIEEWGGDPRNALRLPVAKAQKALQRFASIGKPGAEKILLFTRTLPVLALESNGLRVLVRLGFVEEQKSYDATYRAVRRALEPSLPNDFDWLIAAHQLLRQHGQQLCKRTQPLCAACPLRNACAHFRANPV